MKPILFNTEMVKALLDGRKTVTRRSPFKFEMKEGYNPDWSGYSLGEYFTGRIETGVCLYSRGAHDVWGVRSNVVRPKYVPGDIIYVRETWRCYKYNNMDGDLPFGVQYKADGEKNYFEMDDNERYERFEKLAIKDTWQPSLFMPKEAARIFLKVTGVRAERLQDITEEQAIKEGIKRMFDHLSLEEYERWSKRIGEHRKQEERAWENYLWHGNYGNGGQGNKLSNAWKYQRSGYDSARESFSSLWNSTLDLKDWDAKGWDANPWVWVIEFERISKENAYAETI